MFSQFALASNPLEGTQDQPTVTVVGAGLAGLTAAYRLQQMGYPVEVHEARGRPGGRVLTAYFENSYEELGGKFFEDGGEAKNIKSLTKELGLTVDFQELPFTLNYFSEGKSIPTPELMQMCPEPNEALLRALQEKAQQSQSLRELLELFLPEYPELYRLLNLGMRNYEGSDTKDLSAKYVDLIYRFYTERLCRQVQIFPIHTVKGGNSLLVQALCQALIRPIHYQHILKKIFQNEQGKICLVFNDDQIVSTDYVVLALPCSTLREVEIEIGLIPQDQMDIIQTIQYGTNAKILLPVQLKPDQEFPEFAYVQNGIAWFNRDHSIMTIYYGGSFGVLPPNDDLTEVLDQDLSSILLHYPTIQFPAGTTPILLKEAKDAYTQPIGMYWALEEFSKGSYSNYGIQQFDFLHETVEEFGEVVKKGFRSIRGRIFFAGEHTDIDYPATMEGAVTSGEKVARMLSHHQFGKIK